MMRRAVISPALQPAISSKVALVHYWLVGMRGGEKVLEVLCDLFPDADIYTLVADFDALSPTIKRHRITTSFLQKIGGRKHYRSMLPLMPFALEAFDLTSYDLVISSEAGPAKAVVVRPEAVHICYCHSPMRYIWDLYPQYRANAGFMTRALMSVTVPFLRQWDVTTSSRVDHFIANSAYVAKRIEKYYRRAACVIHPPINVSRFRIAESPQDYYLCAGQITPYKKVELAVDACARLGRKLVVIGSGASDELRARAGSGAEFLGAVDDATMEHHFANCRALLYPGVEDFGMVPIEVMASGRPVIAHARGGALETVVAGKTGVLFYDQTVESLIDAIRKFEAVMHLFSPEVIRQHAQSFDEPRFRKELEQFLGEVALASFAPASARDKSRNG